MQDDNATTHITVNAVLMVVAAGFHLLSCLSVLINVLGLALRLPFFPTPPASDAELAGQLIAYAWMGLVAVMGVIWAPINAYGLIRRRSWVRRSSLGYWIFVVLAAAAFRFPPTVSTLSRAKTSRAPWRRRPTVPKRRIAIASTGGATGSASSTKSRTR